MVVVFFMGFPFLRSYKSLSVSFTIFGASLKVEQQKLSVLSIPATTDTDDKSPQEQNSALKVIAAFLDARLHGDLQPSGH